MIGRREFIKTGLAGSVLLTGVGRVAAAADEEGVMLTAVATSVLAGMLPDDPAARRRALLDTVSGVRQTVSGLSAQSQKEIAELFSLLCFPLSRRFVAGLAPSWNSASEAEVTAFLEAWRRSRFMLFQGAYAALHDLVFGAWYARPEHWEAIDYPGPPEVF